MALTDLQTEILSTLRSAGGFLQLAELLFELRWRGAARWQETASGSVEAELENLVERGFVRGRMNSTASYELTAAGWDACRRPL